MQRCKERQLRLSVESVTFKPRQKRKRDTHKMWRGEEEDLRTESVEKKVKADPGNKRGDARRDSCMQGFTHESYPAYDHLSYYEDFIHVRAVPVSLNPNTSDICKIHTSTAALC